MIDAVRHENSTSFIKPKKGISPPLAGKYPFSVPAILPQRGKIA